MMDERHGDGVAALQFAQEGKQRGYVATDILVDAMQAHERIEDEKARLQPGDGLLEPRTVSLEIEAQTGRRDHLHVERGETDAGRGADAFEAAADYMQGIFGGIKQDAAGAADREAAQTGDAGGDGDRQIEGEDDLPHLGDRPKIWGIMPLWQRPALHRRSGQIDAQTRHRASRS